MVVVVDDLVDVVHVERAGAVRADRAGDVLEQAGELRLVVAGHEFAGGAALRLCPHSRRIADPAAVGKSARRTCGGWRLSTNRWISVVDIQAG